MRGRDEDTGEFLSPSRSLGANVAVLVYMLCKVVKTKRNPYKGELYTDLKEYRAIKALAE